KVYVLGDFSGAPVSLAGKEVRSINEVPAAKLVETMLAAAPGDGDGQTSPILHIGGTNFARQLPILIGLHSPFDAALWDPKEEREAKVHLEGIDMMQLQKAARAKFPQEQRPQRAGEFKFLDEGKIALMKIHGFGGFVDAERKKTLKEFYQESFREMK